VADVARFIREQVLVAGIRLPPIVGPPPSSVVLADDDDLLASYRRLADDVVVEPYTTDSASVLRDTAMALYADEFRRRDSIEQRTAGLLGATAVVGALLVAAGQILLTSGRPAIGWSAWVILAFYVLSLVYFGVAVIIALVVLATSRGYVLGPDDVVAPNHATMADAALYHRHLAARALHVTIGNYQTHNAQMGRLTRGLRSFRNGVMALLIAGVFLAAAGLTRAGPGADTSSNAPVVSTTTVAAQPKG
jgi:hypothetical protein